MFQLYLFGKVLVVIPSLKMVSLFKLFWISSNKSFFSPKSSKKAPVNALVEGG